MNFKLTKHFLIFFHDVIDIKNQNVDTEFKSLWYQDSKLEPITKIHTNHDSHLEFDIFICNIATQNIFNWLPCYKNLHFDRKVKVPWYLNQTLEPIIQICVNHGSHLEFDMFVGNETICSIFDWLPWYQKPTFWHQIQGPVISEAKVRAHNTNLTDHGSHLGFLKMLKGESSTPTWKC